MTDLKTLGEVKAPKDFADRLLAHVGVADSYARFDSVLGPVYVAWNPRGASAAARMASPAGFGRGFRQNVVGASWAGGPPGEPPPHNSGTLRSQHRYNT